MLKWTIGVVWVLAACNAPTWTACEQYQVANNALSWQVRECGSNACVEWHVRREAELKAACAAERGEK